MTKVHLVLYFLRRRKVASLVSTKKARHLRKGLGMIQLGLVVVVIIILILYLKSRPEKEPSSELELKADLLKREVMRLLEEVKKKSTPIKMKRLEIEIQRFQKARRLDELLGKAEREKDPQKAIDYYLEAFSFIKKNNFELERKQEIEEKIKTLQQSPPTRIPSGKR